MYPVNHSCKYVLYDACTGERIFPNREKLIFFLSGKNRKPWEERNTDSYEEMCENQNFSGNDTKPVFHFQECEYFLHLRRYTLYERNPEGYYRIIDLKTLKKEVEEIRNTPKSSHKFIVHTISVHPFQNRHGFYFPQKYRMEEEDYQEHFRGVNPGKTGRSNKDKWENHYISRSERCWKTQTKKNHQYGGDRTSIRIPVVTEEMEDMELE